LELGKGQEAWMEKGTNGVETIHTRKLEDFVFYAILSMSTGTLEAEHTKCTISHLAGR
jgi:hypothetical protein